MKKAIIFVLTLITILTITIIPSFALTDISTYRESQDVYFMPSPYGTIFHPYFIKYTEVTDVTSSPYTKNPDVTGFLYNMFGHRLPDIGAIDSETFYYDLLGGAQIEVIFNADTSIITVRLIADGVEPRTIVSMAYDQNVADFAIFMASDGHLYVGTFYSSTRFTSVTPLTADLYGNIVIPSTYNATDQYENGYNAGYDVGYKEAASANTEQAYNKGFIAGQDTDSIVGNTINGFFDGLTNFFVPFLSMGIGSLTLYTLLGLMIVAAVVCIIIKIVRG